MDLLHPQGQIISELRRFLSRFSEALVFSLIISTALFMFMHNEFTKTEYLDFLFIKMSGIIMLIYSYRFAKEITLWK